jgi:parvulin-like peptidyl-prolyl isomerase
MKLKPMRIVAAALVLLAVLVAAACGSGGSDNQSVPANSVAVVDGTSVTKAQLNALLSRAKLTYKSQKRAFPKAGTSDYQALQAQAVAYLVQRAEYDNRAESMKLQVSDKEIADRVAQIKQQSFQGSQKKFDAALKAQGYTLASLREDVKSQLVSEKIYDAVTKDVKVSDPEITKYYNQNKSQFTTAESRDVRHILVKTKAQADRIYTQLKNGASFAALAKKYSLDPGSKDNGGKLTITRGQTVAPFDQTAFTLSTNVISRPIKTEYGYHVIQPISDVKPATTTSLKDARPQIEATLLEKAKNDAITKWTNDVKDYFTKKVSYAAGYAPPAAATTPTTTSN